MHFTGDVSLGTIFTIVTLVIIAIRFGYRFGQVETTIKTHADMLTSHAERLSTYESHIIDYVADLQRVIGRLEVPERRRTNR